jgi:hypothetical protein
MYNVNLHLSVVLTDALLRAYVMYLGVVSWL